MVSEPREYTDSITTTDGRARTFVVHLPSMTEAETYPLLLLFHGGGGTGARILDQVADMRGLAEDRGFVLVAPDGVDRSWSDGRGTDSELAGVDDVRFVRELVAHLIAELPIDPDRVYATGASNGGGMTYRLGCEASELLAGLAPVIAAVSTGFESTCVPDSPMPMIAISGLDDPLVPFEGGECCHLLPGAGGQRAPTGEVLPAPEWVGFFAASNGCDPVPVTEMLPVEVEDGTSVELRTYTSCEFDTVHYVVHGMGHTWPPHDPLVERVAGQTSHNLVASEVIWEFLSSHA